MDFRNSVCDSCSQLGADLFSLVTSDTRLCQKRFRMDLRKNFFIMRVVKHWKVLPSKVVDMACLSLFKWHLDNVHKNVLQLLFSNVVFIQFIQFIKLHLMIFPSNYYSVLISLCSVLFSIPSDSSTPLHSIPFHSIPYY